MNTTSPTRVVTGEVRLSYAHLFEPQSIHGSKPKYSVSLIIPKTDTETISKIERAIDAAIEAGIGKFGGKRPNKAALKLPLRDGDLERDDEAYKGSFFVNANSIQPPGDRGRWPPADPVPDRGVLGLLCAGEPVLLRVQHERQPWYCLRAGQRAKAP